MSSPAATLHLDVGSLLQFAAKVPVRLRGKGLKAHTAIIAQSGSGKSFTLGRFIEEIAGKTRAKFVILDPNSDFVKISEINSRIWTDVPNLFDHEDTSAKFTELWKNVPIGIRTKRSSTSLGLSATHATVKEPGLLWSELQFWDKTKYLGLSRSNEATLISLLQSADLYLKTRWKVEAAAKGHGDFSRSELQAVLALVAKFLASKRSGNVDLLLEEKAYRLWDDLSVPEEGEHLAEAAEGLFAALKEQSELGVWDSSDNELAELTHRIGDGTASEQILTVDLGSLASPEAKLIVADAVLNKLWDAAQSAWVKAIEKPDEDKRCPVFVVADEAHNLAPVDVKTPLAMSVNRTLAKIATEGRKYGLFLMLATQRPSRIDLTLLSQCDNLCLMKMNNRHDLHLVEEVFGIVPEGWAKKAMDFKIGNALLCGSFVDGALYTHIAPRRTVEGGASLKDKHWLKDVVP